MIGRMIKGKSYIPFYMEEQYMYDNIKTDDGKQRVFPLIYPLCAVVSVLRKYRCRAPDLLECGFPDVLSSFWLRSYLAPVECFKALELTR